MKYICIVLFYITLCACSPDTPLRIEELTLDNGIYTYHNQPYTGKAYTYAQDQTTPTRTIECSLNKGIQICIVNEFTDTGELILSGTLRNGKKHALWKTYIIDNTHRISYKNTQAIHTQRYLAKEQIYNNDIAHGTYISYYTPNREHDHNHMYEYPAVEQSARRAIYEQGKYINGEKDGVWYIYYPNGTMLSKTTYSHNVQDGTYTAYHSNGIIKEQGTYHNGKQEGRWITYYDSGQIQSERTFHEGIQEGVEINYHSNARIKDTLIYEHGLVRGIVHSYDKDGNLEKTTFYDVMPQL